MWAYCNGAFVPHDQPLVQLTDRGLTFADGLFEITLVMGGTPLFMSDHLRRMTRSAKTFDLNLPLSADELDRVARELVSRNGIELGEIYISLTRGVDGNRDHRYPGPGADSTLYILAFPLRSINPDNWTSGVHVYSYPDLRHQLCEHKTLNLFPNVMAKNHAYERGGYEAVMYREDEQGRYVTEGGSSSYFCMHEGILRTPAIDNLLPGITRGKVIGLAKEIGIPVREDRLRWEEFESASELFLASTVSRVMPIRGVDEVVLSAPGEVTSQLMKAYARLIAEYLDRHAAE